MGNNESYQKSHNFFGPPLGSSLCRHWCNPHLATTAHTGADTAFDRREVYGCHLLHRVGANRFTAAHVYFWHLLWVSGVGDIMRLLFQPPAEVLPAPDSMVVHAALGYYDVFRVFSNHYYRMV